MNNIICGFTTLASRINPQYIRLALLILTISFLALGASAPADGGCGLPGG